MATTAVCLQLRSRFRPVILNPTLTRFSSTDSTNPTSSSESPEDETSNPSQQNPPPPSSSFFSDVKASLKHKNYSFANSFSPSSTPGTASFDRIFKNLSEFRRISAAPPPSSAAESSSSGPISFHELYKRNIESERGPGSSNPDATRASAASRNFDTIRSSLRQFTLKNQNNSGPKANDSMSLKRFRDTLNMRPGDSDGKGSIGLIGGSGTLPPSIFGREAKGKDGNDGGATGIEFLRQYNYADLGARLRNLRPEKKEGKSWFSLDELSQRLVALRKIEEKESQDRVGGIAYKDLRDSLVKLKNADLEKSKKNVLQRVDVLGQLGGTPSYMLAPPKEHLVEKFFHPDNMSSAEKLKLELNRVRDEFKMSESDCGSARVQVAQLTTKIKHLSTTLHKKDKHSRKGLQGMVQQRKKLLKYLRRTDWDSYSLVLSKLGLRDNPDYKH